MCLSKTHQPNVIFLSERRKNKEYVDYLRFRLGMKNVFNVSAQGKGGGLGVFWDDVYTLELNKFVLLMAQSGGIPPYMGRLRQVKGMSCGIFCEELSPAVFGRGLWLGILMKRCGRMSIFLAIRGLLR